MIPIMVKGPAFECGYSCETILYEGDVAYIVQGQVICPECAQQNAPEA